jgi:regulator of replication initiation timing
MPCISGNWGIGGSQTITEIDGHTFLHDRDVTPKGLACCCGKTVARIDIRPRLVAAEVVAGGGGWGGSPKEGIGSSGGGGSGGPTPITVKICEACGDGYRMDQGHCCDAWTRRRKIDALQAEVERLKAETKSLREDNVFFTKEHVRLRGLLRQAEAFVARVEQDDTRRPGCTRCLPSLSDRIRAALDGKDAVQHVDSRGGEVVRFDGSSLRVPPKPNEPNAGEEKP